MDCVIGTSKGLFVLDGTTGSARPVLRDRSVRDLARVNGSILAGAETGCLRSDDGGETWQPSGIDGRMVWHMTRVPAWLIWVPPRSGATVILGNQLLSHAIESNSQEWRVVANYG